MSTYTPIASQTLSSTTSSVTFSGIPQTYTDLVLVCNTIVSSGTGAELSLQFNSDTGNNYSNTYLLGTGSVTASGRASNIAYADCGYLSSNSGNPNTRIINIQNYSNTTTNKTIVSRASGENGAQVTAYVNLWRSTAAITSIRIYSANSLTYASGSTFTLYGIGAGSPKAFGGDEVTTDGTYWYHTYRSSGIFAPMQSLTCDYVVVAGGGGGGGAGSGAGGFKTSIGGSALSLTNGSNYTVTIGAGGTGGSSCYGTPTTAPTQGSNSVFSSITATGGGRGGTVSSLEGTATGTSSAYLSGGSGGGACYNSGTSNYGLGTSGEGNNGGQDLHNGSPYSSGGGGGAGGVGQNTQSDSVCGNGGAGTYNAITNGAKIGEVSSSNYYLAGGGGGGIYGSAGTGTGGTGGLGGGGNGSSGASSTTKGENGDANTGGGGGGSSQSSSGTNGGSGVVIVRYAV